MLFLNLIGLAGLFHQSIADPHLEELPLAHHLSTIHTENGMEAKESAVDSPSFSRRVPASSSAAPLQTSQSIKLPATGVASIDLGTEPNLIKESAMHSHEEEMIPVNDQVTSDSTAMSVQSEKSIVSVTSSSNVPIPSDLQISNSQMTAIENKTINIPQVSSVNEISVQDTTLNSPMDSKTASISPSESPKQGCHPSVEPDEILSVEQMEDVESYEIDDGTHFLSFEEWKKQKGVESTKDNDHPVQMRPPKPVSQKDSGVIGEEMEIDFSNFFSDSNDNEEEEEGKIYKDKFNYASFDCAATIVKTNSEAKGATSILFEDKDSYLLNPCSAPNKFVVIELCQDILVDSFVVANLEFFSSTFKKVSLSVSESFPIQKNGWTNLGIFQAKDIRDYQAFHIENPKIWAKYVKIELLEHYGNEYYCPLTIARIHGRTMMQEYKQEESLKRSEKEETVEQVEIRGEETSSEVVDLKERQQNISNQEPETELLENCNTIENCEEIVSNYSEGEISEKTKSFTSFNADLVASINCISEVNNCSLPTLKFDELFRNQRCEIGRANGTLSELSKASTSSSSNTQQSQHIQQNSGTQESIYKNIMKRLSLLESNASLSVLYIEEQSKLLSNAFTSLEKRHANNLNKLIIAFNNTVNDQILILTDFYNTLQQETQMIFQNQRANHESLLVDAYSQINQLTNELKLQKLLATVNFVLIVGVLIYVTLTRDTFIDTEYVESEKEWYGQQKQRLASTGSKIKANIKKYYRYTSDDGSFKSSPNPSSVNSEEEQYDGEETTSNNSKPTDRQLKPLNVNELDSIDESPGNSSKLKVKVVSADLSDHELFEQPPTPEYSDEGDE